MGEKKVTKYCPNCGKLSDFGENQLYCDFLDCQPKPKEMKRLIRVYLEEEHNALIKRAQQDLIRKIEKMLFRISGYKSEINSFVNIGRQNCMNDIDNELMEIKRDLK